MTETTTTSRKRLKAYGLIAVVFVLGAATGAGASHAYWLHRYAEAAGDERDDLRERRRFAALSRQLSLTSEQEERVHRIVQKHMESRREAMRRMFERCGDDVRAEKDRLDDEIRTVLTPPQQQRFDELAERHRERFLFGPGHGPRRHGHGPR